MPNLRNTANTTQIYQKQQKLHVQLYITGINNNSMQVFLTISKHHQWANSVLLYVQVITYWPLRPRIASSASSLRWKTIKAKQGVLFVFQTSMRRPYFSNVFRNSDSVQLTGKSLTCTRTPSLSPLALRLRRLRFLELRLLCRLRLRLRLLLLLLDESRLVPISGHNKNITNNN